MAMQGMSSGNDVLPCMHAEHAPGDAIASHTAMDWAIFSSRKPVGGRRVRHC